MEYNLLYVKNLSFAAANRPRETLTQPILYLEPNDYKYNFVNIDSCHQCNMEFWGPFWRCLSCELVFSGKELKEMASVFAG